MTKKENEKIEKDFCGHCDREIEIGTTYYRFCSYCLGSMREEAREETINEFVQGKRCLHCGKIKPSGLIDMCPKCLEEE